MIISSNNSTSKLYDLHFLGLRVLYAAAMGLLAGSIGSAIAGVAITLTGYDIGSSAPQIAWIDNNQVLFIGKKSNQDPKQSSYASAKLFIWNDATKTAREYSDALSFCYSDGWMRYGIGKNDEAGNRIVYMGPLGKEVETKVPPVMPHAMRVPNSFSCKSRSSDDFSPPLPIDREYLVLREGDGYLSLNPRDAYEYRRDPKNITLHREKGANPVVLPITWNESIGGWGKTYSEYRRAYVLPPLNFVPPKGPGNWDLRGNWDSREPRVVYLLHPSDGQVEKVVIPPTEIFRHPRPTKTGWIYGGGIVKVASSAGLYLYDGKRSELLEVGGIFAIAVNLDGCKAAVAINNFPRDMGTPTTLKIFNVCIRS